MTEAWHEIRSGYFIPGRHWAAALAWECGALSLSGVQPPSAQEIGPVLERNPTGGRYRLALLALRAQWGGVL